jgi:tRNA-2-methylthio-N6-dimethylallyladenosine synthase
MNVYDSVKMANLLSPFGYKLTHKMEESDMVILNTCHIREKATEKVYSELGKIRDYKKEKAKKGNGELITVVAGCVAQAEGEEIMQRAKVVDIVVGPQSLQNLPELIAKLSRENKAQIDLNFSPISKFDNLPEELNNTSVSSFLTIQEGCDKFCKFCVVPYTRGAQYSRPIEEVYREALLMASSGAVEITLLGQNVSAYETKEANGSSRKLAELIKMIAKIPQIQRIRYTTSHPNDMDDDLIALHGYETKLMPFLHLPVQSGSNRILQEMNRKHDIDHYLKVIDKLKTARPDISFSSDFIVGYPGETDQDFEDTCNLVNDVKFTQAYSFKYSPRAGTPASVKEQISEEIKTNRILKLQSIISHHQHAFNQEFAGKEVEVLFDRIGKKDGQIIGKTPYMQSVYLNQATDLLNKIVSVKIKHIGRNSMRGETIKDKEVVAA